MRAQNSNFTSMLKTIIAAFYEGTGSIREEPLRRHIKTELSPERILFLRRFTMLLMLTDYTDKFTKDYLISGLTLRELAEAGQDFNKVRGRVSNNLKKVKCAFGENVLENILHYRNRSIDGYMDTVNRLLMENTDNLYQMLSIQLPDALEVSTELTDEVFQVFIEYIMPYTKGYMELTKRALTPEMLSYFKCLVINKHLLKGVDRSRYNQLLDCLDYDETMKHLQEG